LRWASAGGSEPLRQQGRYSTAKSQVTNTCVESLHFLMAANLSTEPIYQPSLDCYFLIVLSPGRRLPPPSNAGQPQPRPLAGLFFVPIAKNRAGVISKFSLDTVPPAPGRARHGSKRAGRPW